MSPFGTKQEVKQNYWKLVENRSFAKETWQFQDVEFSGSRQIEMLNSLNLGIVTPIWVVDPSNLCSDCHRSPDQHAIRRGGIVTPCASHPSVENIRIYTAYLISDNGYIIPCND